MWPSSPGTDSGCSLSSCHKPGRLSASVGGHSLMGSGTSICSSSPGRRPRPSWPLWAEPRTCHEAAGGYWPCFPPASSQPANSARFAPFAISSGWIRTPSPPGPFIAPCHSFPCRRRQSSSTTSSKSRAPRVVGDAVPIGQVFWDCPASDVPAIPARNRRSQFAIAWKDLSGKPPVPRTPNMVKIPRMVLGVDEPRTPQETSGHHRWPFAVSGDSGKR